MSRDRILITGATGRIGAPLIKALRAKGFELILLSRKDLQAFHAPGIRAVKGDITDPSSYSEALDDAQAVLHLAGVTHTNNRGKYFEVNANATLKLVKMCEARGVERFIHISTRAISENGGAYSRSKLIAENYVKESRLNWVIMRLGEVYGLQEKRGVDMLFERADKSLFIPVLGSGEYGVSPVHVTDVISAILAVVENRDIKRKVYTIAGPEEFSYNDLVDKILAIKGAKKSKVHIPVWVFILIARVIVAFTGDRVFALDQVPRLLSPKSADISQAVNDLEFHPKTFEEAVTGG